MAGPATRRPLLVALAVGLALTALTDWRVGLYRQTNFLDRLEDTAARLETLPARHQAMGAALTLAGLAPASREAVAGRLPPDAPEALAALGFAATAVQASNAFLVDERGTIVAYHLESGRSATGRNLAQRPYVKSALAGHPNMYAAVGSNTQERGIYVAAPVRADAGQGNRVIGAAVIKVGFDQVDPLLAQDYADYALVSPEGVVFASTQAAWRYTVAAGTADLAHVARHDRAANHFAGHAPRPLADLVPNLTTAQALPVDWADPEGAWQLLGLPRQRFGLSWLEALLVLVSGSGLSIAGLAWRRQRQQREQERRQAEQELAGYALRLEQIAEQKSRIATLTAQLQQADGVASLAAVFLEATAGMLGTRQGTVYYLAGDGALHLAAGYGCAAGEAARPPAVIALGAGLVGQCARDRETIHLTGTPEHYWLIRSGLGATPPATLLLIPVLRDERLLGVVELATLAPADQDDLIRLTDLIPLLALNLELQLSRAEARAATQPETHPGAG